MKIIKRTFEKYDKHSLARALFTITSWISNRRFIAFGDHLNRTFIEMEKTKKHSNNKKITTYEEFQFFYNEISILFSGFEMLYEDFPVDTGEVHFYSGERSYKVFIGNGDENSYESCFLIENIVRVIEDDKLLKIWKEILTYEDYILSKIYNNDYVLCDNFQCPPEEYYENILDSFDTFKNQNLSAFFDGFVSVNDKLYSFYTKQEKLPVFLPMMKECFLEKIINEYSLEKVRLGLWYSLINCIE